MSHSSWVIFVFSAWSLQMTWHALDMALETERDDIQDETVHLGGAFDYISKCCFTDNDFPTCFPQVCLVRLCLLKGLQKTAFQHVSTQPFILYFGTTPPQRCLKEARVRKLCVQFLNGEEIIAFLTTWPRSLPSGSTGNRAMQRCAPALCVCGHQSPVFLQPWKELSGKFETPHLRLLETVNFPSSLKSLTFGDMFNQSLGGGFRSMFIYYPESLPVIYWSPVSFIAFEQQRMPPNPWVNHQYPHWNRHLLDPFGVPMLFLRHIMIFRWVYNPPNSIWSPHCCW